MKQWSEMKFEETLKLAREQLSFIEEHVGNGGDHPVVRTKVLDLFDTVNHLTSFWTSTKKHAEHFDSTCAICKGLK